MTPRTTTEGVVSKDIERVQVLIKVHPLSVFVVTAIGTQIGSSRLNPQGHLFNDMSGNSPAVLRSPQRG